MNDHCGTVAAIEMVFFNTRYYHPGGYTPTVITCHITMQMQSDAAKAAPLI